MFKYQQIVKAMYEKYGIPSVHAKILSFSLKRTRTQWKYVYSVSVYNGNIIIYGFILCCHGYLGKQFLSPMDMYKMLNALNIPPKYTHRQLLSKCTKCIL